MYKGIEARRAGGPVIGMKSMHDARDTAAAVGAEHRERVVVYARTLQDIFGGTARALTLFGHVVTPAFDTTRHLIRSVLVTESVDLGMLRRLAERGPDLARERITAPLVMTPEYIRASRDTFPLELMAIQECHVTVFGEDYFAALTFEAAHVRLQCERELKTLTLAMRQGLLASTGDEQFLASIEIDLAGGLVRTLRGLLWLKGDREKRSESEMLAALERRLARTFPGIQDALDEHAPHDWAEFERLYRDVESLGKAVNDW